MQIDWAKVFIDSIEQTYANAKSFWLTILIFLFLSLIIWIIKYIKLRNSKLADIDKMSGEEFENKLAISFRNKGYNVIQTGNRKGDYGVDLVIDKEGVKTAVQAKRYKNIVGVNAVQEVVSGRLKYTCSKAIVVTNSDFSPQAYELARVNDVELWNRDKLESLIIEESGWTR